MDKINLLIQVIAIVGIASSVVILWLVFSVQSAVSSFTKSSEEIAQKHENYVRRIESQILEAEIESQEKTFELISKEIHDNISQSLSLVVINLNYLSNDTIGQERTTLRNSISHLKKVIEDLNNLSKSLDSDLIETHGLVAACKFECERWNRLYNTSVSLETYGEIRHLDKTMELFILRIIQESLSNAIKYSRAAAIKTTINYKSEGLSFTIEDNGIGFDLLDALETKIIGKRSGIKNMKQRAHMIAGTFEILTSPNKGTKIKVDIDLNKYDEKISWISRRSQITSERSRIND